MKKLLTALMAVALVIAALVNVPRALADEPVPPPPPPAPYSPQTGVIFNNPTGTLDEQYALLDHITKSIVSAPKGSMIRIAVYSFSYTPMSEALIAAYKRGVHVRLLVDSHAITAEMKLLKKTLGANKTKPSFYATCKYGCMSSQPSFMHAKLYMFSTAGTSKSVSMISSANPAFSGGTQAWNNIYTIVGDAALYKSNYTYFNDMLKDKTNTHYYRTASSGPYKEYFFPRNGTTKSSDTIYNVLREVKCTAAPGFGDGAGHTTVRIAAYKWTALRVDVAQQVTALRKQGCDVQVIYSADTVDREVVAELMKTRTPVFDARRDRFNLTSNNSANFNLYVHSKYVLISGGYGSRSDVKAVYTGSPNFSANSLRQSNEIMLRVELPQVYDAFLANYATVQAWTVPVTSVPKATAKSLAQSAQEHRSGDDYRIEADDE